MKIQYLLSFAGEGTDVKERCKKENDFSKFVDSVPVIDRGIFPKNVDGDLSFFKFSFAFLMSNI